MGRGAVYALGHDLATYAVDRCYVNCFEPAGDVLRLILRDALREGASGHVVLKHAIPGGADSSLILSHDIDAPDAYNAGEWGQPGALQMAALERSLGVRGTYNMTTDYVAGYFQPPIAKALCDAGMCPLGLHSVRHLGTFATHPRGSCTETKASYGPKVAPTLCGEVRVPIEILTPLSGSRAHAFRAPYLMLNPSLFDVLAQNGVEYDSSFAIGDLKYNLPIDGEHIGQKQSFFHHKPILEFPVSCEDGRDSVVGGVHKRVELQPSNRATFRDQWRYILLRNAANEAITTLLVHPSRGYEMPDDNIGVKVDAVGELVRFAKEQKNVSFSTIDDFGRFWSARAQTTIDATYDAADGYSGTITTGVLPVHDLALEMGDAIASFTCEGCGASEVHGKRVLLPLLKAHARLTFKAQVVSGPAAPITK